MRSRTCTRSLSALDGGNLRRTTPKGVCRKRLAGLLLLALALAPQPTGADVFSQLRLVVNVLPGNAQNNAQINQLVDGVNDIFAKCPGRMTFTTAKITRLGVFPAGFLVVGPGNTVLAGDGNPPKPAVDAAANPEIGGITGGFKVFLAAGLQRTNGRATNGAAHIGNGSALITQQAGIDGDAHTWAHEIAHGLGLQHVNPGRGNLPNLMFPGRRRAGVPAGSGLTQAQCDQLMDGYRRQGAAFEVTVAQLGLIPDDRQRTTFLVTALPSAPGGGKPVAGVDWLAPHLVTVQFRGAPALDFVDVTLDLRAALPRSGALEARFDLPVDVDGNGATGESLGASTGVDAIVAIELSGVWPFQPPDGARIGSLRRPGGDLALVRLDPPEILPRPQVTTPPDAATMPEEALSTLHNDALRVTVPVSALGTLGDTVRVGLEARAGGAVVSVPQQPVPTRERRPTLATPDRRVRAGATVPLTGEGFGPGRTVTLFWGHNLSESIGTAQVNAQGQFSTDLRIPRVTAGDYLLDAVDDAGGVGITVLTVLLEPAAPALIGPVGLVLVLLLLLALAVVLLGQARRRKRA